MAKRPSKPQAGQLVAAETLEAAQPAVRRFKGLSSLTGPDGKIYLPDADGIIALPAAEHWYDPLVTRAEEVIP